MKFQTIVYLVINRDIIEFTGVDQVGGPLGKVPQVRHGGKSLLGQELAGIIKNGLLINAKMV